MLGCVSTKFALFYIFPKCTKTVLQGARFRRQSPERMPTLGLFKEERGSGGPALKFLTIEGDRPKRVPILNSIFHFIDIFI